MNIYNLEYPHFSDVASVQTAASGVTLYTAGARQKGGEFCLTGV
jgi:hypothetical protein